MTATYLDFPYEEEIFNHYWAEATDPTRDALLSSGAIVADSTVADMISMGSNLYTMPYYNLLGGEEDNYDGKTDITATESTGDSLTGVVFGRAHAFKARDFIADFNSGANPLRYAATKVGNWYNHKRQKRILGILNGVSGVTAFKEHVIDASTAPISETTLGNAAVAAMGDQADGLTLAFMHSAVANKLANLQLLEYAKYTDANGIERQVRNIGTINGMTVIIDDGAPFTPAVTSGSASPAKYTTYLLGSGFLRYAQAPVAHPSEYSRDPKTNGGEEYIYTRIRETIHPYGFSFKAPSAMTASPTDTQLFAKANWELKYDPKTVPFVAITTQA